LSPILFNILTNDPRVEDGILVKYADDMTFVKATILNDNREKECSTGQSKTTCKSTPGQPKEKKTIFMYTVNDDQLGTVESMKLLGMKLSNQLTWGEHVIATEKKFCTKLFMLQRLHRCGLQCSCHTKPLNMASQSSYL
jgi:hypothetical protein